MIRSLDMFEKIEKMQLFGMGIILALGLVVAVKSATYNLQRDGISVTGSAYEIVQSDSARFEFNIATRKSDRAQAYQIIQKQIPEVVAFVKSYGFEDSDIELKASSGYNSYKYNANGTMTNEIAYYNLSQPIILKSNDVQKVKKISVDIQNLISKGIEINPMEPQYYYSKLSDLKVKLLQDATTDAKERASAMLSATHNKTGSIQSVKMGVFQITPVDSTSVSDMGINDTSTIEKKVTAVANVTFRIR